MSDMILLLGTSRFAVAARALRLNSRLFMDHPGLDTYQVQTAVSSRETFEGFVRAIEDGSDLSVTADNLSELSLLCEEFGADKLRRAIDFGSESRAFDFGSEVSGFALRHQVEQLAKEVGLLRQDCRAIERHENEFVRLRAEVTALRDSVAGLEILRTEIGDMKRALLRLQGLTKVEIPMKTAQPLNGIIAYLTKKHGGNVHEKEIVTITSKSVRNDANGDDDPEYAPRSIAELNCDSLFRSKDNEPGQWVCWDFHEMRVRLSSYTIEAQWAQFWVVEVSVDGRSWKEIHRQKDDQLTMTTFAVSSSAECRFIRLTQTDKDYSGSDELLLFAVEFFGTLSE